MKDIYMLSLSIFILFHAQPRTKIEWNQPALSYSKNTGRFRSQPM